MGGSEFHVIRTYKAKLLPAYAFDYINRKEVRKIGNLPHKKDQRRFVKTVETHKAKIIAAEAILSTASSQKAAILKKYL